MMRLARTGSWCAALAFSLTTILTACTEEEPTSIGGDLLPEGDIETFEVFLEPEQFLLLASAYSGYTAASNTTLLIAAREFEGVYNANTIVRFARPPESISVRNSGGNVVTDTLPRWVSGDIIVRIDTALSTNNGVAPIAVYTTAEEWHSLSATWTHRVDTSGVRLPWSQPGGTPGELLGRASRASGDSVFIPIDSATIANWADLDGNVRGAIIRLDPDAPIALGERLRISEVMLRLNARSSINADTIVTVFAGTSGETFVFDPQPPHTATPILAGGVPAWRTYMEFRDDLPDLVVPCPTISSTCSVRLSDADITRAELLLQTAQAPEGFAPEGDVVLQARVVLRSPSVPIERSPLTNGRADIDTDTTRVAPGTFRTGTGTTVRLPMTFYFRALVADTTETERRLSRSVVLMTDPESSTVGAAAFALSPRLRLILTVDPEVLR